MAIISVHELDINFFSGFENFCGYEYDDCQHEFVFSGRNRTITLCISETGTGHSLSMTVHGKPAINVYYHNADYIRKTDAEEIYFYHEKYAAGSEELKIDSKNMTIEASIIKS